MPEFVYDQPLGQLALWFTIVSIGSLVVGLLVIKPIFRLILGTGPEFNASINYVTSGFSLFYGLLLGLLTVAAYQNSQMVRDAIMDEATSFGSLYAQVNAYPEPLRGDVKAQMRDYVLYTVNKEWPAHEHGEILNGGYNRADAIWRRLASYEPATEGQRILHSEVIASFQQFSDARQRRLSGVLTEIPGVLWYAVLMGAVINIFLIVLLRVRFLQHVLLGGITAFFLGVILFVITSLDRPLRGETGLRPEPFEILWQRAMVWDEPIEEQG